MRRSCRVLDSASDEPSRKSKRRAVRTTPEQFERGYTIPQVAQFTLHESWSEPQRYTHLLKKNPRDLPDPKARLTQVAHSAIHDLPVAA
jgi:hypothetical protein